MSIETVADLVQRARAESSSASGPTDQTRAKLMRVAAEFESLLLLQMLKEMRRSGSWDEEDEHKDGFGSQTLLETVDVELSNHLAKAQGFGLAKEMLAALERMTPGAASRPGASGVETLAMRPSATPSTAVASLEMPEGTVTSGFGWRRDPLGHATKFHQGIDIRAAYGQDIQAAGAGRVISAGTHGGYGETVLIEHAGGVRTRYAHLSMAVVAPGDEVAAGQVVGRAGRSGRATGTHLHFEVTTASGERVDPAVFSRFKAEGLVADWAVGTTPMQETRRHDDTN
ncbi:MAG TPA: peptidoglycan DD-metalloendopeptidase family protein [Vicinamibacterales bacterium]|nr:peptidoglycan DD-metalloendopeptidase family protein [Vicinamibacterales bacterium]